MATKWLESQTPNHKVVGSNPIAESNTTARHNWRKIDARANPSHVRRFGETNERVRRWTSQEISQNIVSAVYGVLALSLSVKRRNVRALIRRK